MLLVVKPRPIVVFLVGNVSVGTLSALHASLPSSLVEFLVGHGISKDTLPILKSVPELAFVEEVLSQKVITAGSLVFILQSLTLVSVPIG